MSDELGWGLYLSLSGMKFLEFTIWGAWAPVLASRLLGPLKMSGKQLGWIYGTLPLACIQKLPRHGREWWYAPERGSIRAATDPGRSASRPCWFPGTMVLRPARIRSSQGAPDRLDHGRCSTTRPILEV